MIGLPIRHLVRISIFAIASAAFLAAATCAAESGLQLLPGAIVHSARDWRFQDPRPGRALHAMSGRIAFIPAVCGADLIYVLEPLSLAPESPWGLQRIIRSPAPNEQFPPCTSEIRQDGDRIVVMHGSATILVFRRDLGCSGCWGLEQKLPRSPTIVPAVGISALDIRGDEIVTGFPEAVNAYPARGAAVLYRRVGSGAAPWVEQRVITPPPSAPAVAGFGTRLRLTAHGLLASVPVDLPSRASIFECGRSDNWTCSRAIAAPDPEASDDLGSNFETDGDRVFLGIPTRGSVNGMEPPGAVFEFRRHASGWSYVRRVRPTVSQAGERFGSSMSISGSRLVVGADGWVNGDGVPGRVLVFDAPLSGDPIQIEEIHSPDGSTESALSSASGAVGESLVLFRGARTSVYRATIEGSYGVTQRLPDDLGLALGRQRFGKGVGVSRTDIVVGVRGNENLGRIEVRRQDGSDAGESIARIDDPWAQPFLSPFPDDMYVAGDLILATKEGPAGDPLVGVWRRDPAGDSWQLEAEFSRPGNDLSERFGLSVALAEDRVAIASGCLGGIPACTTVLYVFEPIESSPGNWFEAGRIPIELEFGRTIYPRSIAIDSDRAVVSNGSMHAVMSRTSGGSWVHTWTGPVKTSANEAKSTTGIDAFCSSHALTLGRDFFAVGCIDSVEIFRQSLVPPQWSRVDYIPNPEPPATLAYFGSVLATDGDDILVGAPWQQDPDDINSPRGAVIVLRRVSASDWEVARTIRGTDFEGVLGLGEYIGLGPSSYVLGASESSGFMIGTGAIFVGAAVSCIHCDGFESTGSAIPH